MATKTKKTAKRKSVKRGKTRSAATGRRKAATGRRKSSRRSTKSTGLGKTVRKTTRRGLQTAREGLETVQQAAGKALTAAKSTALQTFEEVKARMAGDRSDAK